MTSSSQCVPSSRRIVRSLSAGVRHRPITRALSIAATLSPDIRQEIGIQVLSSSQAISHIGSTHQVSRKLVYQQQSDKA